MNIEGMQKSKLWNDPPNMLTNLHTHSQQKCTETKARDHAADEGRWQNERETSEQ